MSRSSRRSNAPRTAFRHRRRGASSWCDPLDGTKEFIARNGEFTVNIALIEDGKPVLGVVYLPASDACYAGLGDRAERRIGTAAPEPIAARVAPESGLVMAISRSHADGEVERAKARGLHVADTIIAGSSLKFCRIAEGVADLYPRFGTTMEWDTAAGQAVLEAAGGRVETTDGAPFRYGKPGFRNTHFIAYGRKRATGGRRSSSRRRPISGKPPTALREGRLVAFPTETVYGLGGDATSDRAVAAIYAAKGRPSFNPLIVHVGSFTAAGRLVGDDARRPRSWRASSGPGALTLVLPRKPRCGSRCWSAPVSTAPRSACRRIPRRKACCSMSGLPLAAPSANPSGKMSPDARGSRGRDARRQGRDDHRRRPLQRRDRIHRGEPVATRRRRSCAPAASPPSSSAKPCR